MGEVVLKLLLILETLLIPDISCWEMASSYNGQGSQAFDEFYKEVKEVEKRDECLTPAAQIERLTKPGHTYRNLNPFEVLQVDPDQSLEEVKKKFRRMSILVHPDKNQGDADRAQIAFDAVKRAWNLLETKETRKACLEVVEEAKGRTNINMEEKRRKLRKEGKPAIIEEDNPVLFKKAVGILTMKLFADLERKRQQNEDKISADAKKKREKELEDEERKEKIKEFEKNWEDSRQGRVDSWLSFKKGGSGPPAANINTVHPSGGGKIEKKEKKEKKMKNKFSPIGFRPPKTKPESI